MINQLQTQLFRTQSSTLYIIYKSDKAMYTPRPTNAAPTFLLVVAAEVLSVVDEDSVVEDDDSLDDEDEDSCETSDTVSEMVDTRSSTSDGDTVVASM